LEEQLEDTSGALADAVAQVQRLARDLARVEAQLAVAAHDKHEAVAEGRRLAQQLAREVAAQRSLKRKLDAFGAATSGYGGHLPAGLQLQGLDLAACVCEVKNATNMDVSLAGWTVRVVADAHLVDGAGPDGAVRALRTAQRLD
jgi:hypothetical protein